VQLINSFTVPVPLEEAWSALMNVERVAVCIPGATLDSINGDDFTGRVKVKMGPILLTYLGRGRFVQRSHSDYRAVIEASGKEAKGAGIARAQTTASLVQARAGTDVNVVTELTVTGKAAQFGRGMLEDVSSKIFDQFALALASQLSSERSADGDAPAERTGTSTAPSAPPRQSPEVLDLMSVAGGSVIWRVAPPFVFLLLVLAVRATKKPRSTRSRRP